MVRESTFADTWNAMRVGMFALMSPVITSTEGRWVARIEMDARGSRFLSQARDQLLDFLADDHHQIGQFIDDHDDERQRGEFLHVLRHDARNALSDLLHADRILDRIAGVRGLLHFAIETADVTHAQHAT